MEDIFPSLLQKIKAEFDKARLDSEILEELLEKLEENKANYLDANQYAIEIGEILSKVLGAYLNNESLPNGKMYYNIAKRLLDDVLGRNYDLVSDYTEKVQEDLNLKANLHISAQVPELNQDRINGLVNRLASEDDFEVVKWLVGETIVNFTQSIVDDAIQKTWYFSIKQDLALKLLDERLESVVSGAKNWKAVINILPFPMIFTDAIVIVGVPLNIIRKMVDGRTYIPENGVISIKKMWSVENR